MNTFLKELKKENNYTLTENGDLSYKSTLNSVLDLFAVGGAYRRNSDKECILLFKKAFNENKELALKCLFYLRDCRGGQGERRFFRVCYKWLSENYPEIAIKNLENIPFFGRYDDLVFLIDTKIKKEVLNIIKEQLKIDNLSLHIENEAISLLGKWLPSENASSRETKRLAAIIRKELNLSRRNYRKMLSSLRERLLVLERLMSLNRWEEIHFDKIPSKAGLKYRNAFARRDIIAKKYEQFAKDENTKVNAEVLYPNDVVHIAYEKCDSNNEIERAMLQKYWDNLKDYYNGRKENGIAVVDVSGSMYGQPIEVAVGLGAYIADKAHGPFANHFITFSKTPELVEFEGVDIYDKLNNASDADWGMNTDIKAVLNLLLNTAKVNNVKKEDIPERLYIFSDMQFDNCCSPYDIDSLSQGTFFENEKTKWEQCGYALPQIIFWNVNAAYKAKIPAIGEGFSYVSGFSPSMIDCILSGKDGIDLMLEKLNSERYENVKI